MKTFYTLLLLILANVFMTLAWYGHLKWKDASWAKDFGLMHWIIFSWAIAFFEYCIQVPANKIGYLGNNGPFQLVELKILQEVITLLVFTFISYFVFKGESLKINHLYSFICLIAAVYFAFKN